MSAKLKFNSGKIMVKAKPPTNGYVVETANFKSNTSFSDAELISRILPWISLEKFRMGVAETTDWRQLQFWLYFAEEIVANFIYEKEEEKEEIRKTVSDGIQALYVSGRRFRESGNEELSLKEEEREQIREALLIGDAFKEIATQSLLAKVILHIRDVLNQPPTK